MGIVEETLAEFTLSTGEEIKIEYNEGDVIHMHIESVRLDFSKSEFLTLADATGTALEQLQEMKDLDDD